MHPFSRLQGPKKCRWFATMQSFSHRNRRIERRSFLCCRPSHAQRLVRHAVPGERKAMMICAPYSSLRGRQKRTNVLQRQAEQCWVPFLTMSSVQAIPSEEEANMIILHPRCSSQRKKLPDGMQLHPMSSLITDLGDAQEVRYICYFKEYILDNVTV